MNSLLYKSGGIRASPSLLALSEWQEKEKQAMNCAVDEEGCLLDNLTLELRVHPPEVHIDNAGNPHSTIVTIDSANRPGSLVFVVQHFTELGLRINSARISSDGGWFHDMFLICEAQGGKVRNPKKLHSIKQMLNVYMEDEDVVVNSDDTDDMNRVETTVFEIAGADRAGLLSDVMQLFTHHGCDARSAAVWTYKGRVAFVFSVTEKGKPLVDAVKLARLRQMVTEIVKSSKSAGVCTVHTHRVRGEVHHDRRLHQLMLQEERDEWERANGGFGVVPSLPSKENGISNERNCGFAGSSSPTDSAMSVHAAENAPTSISRPTSASQLRSLKYDRPIVEISHCSKPDYWTVSIRCRDRTKLLFDTVCTLADLDFDIYHGTIDSDPEGINAYQEYFIRPRSGDGDFTERDAALLKAMLESSIERRFPKGMKVHVRSLDRFGCLAALAHQLHQAGLTVTRAKVRTFATSNSSGHTLYVMDAHGGAPDRARVQQALVQCGGKMVDVSEMSEGRTPIVDGHRFSFSFLQRQWTSSWGGSSPDSTYGSSL